MNFFVFFSMFSDRQTINHHPPWSGTSLAQTMNKILGSVLIKFSVIIVSWKRGEVKSLLNLSI